MTKSVFEQLKKDSRFTISSSVWYGEFPFRVSFKGWDMFDGGWLNNYHRNTHIRKKLDSLNHEYRFRNDTQFNVYLKTEEALQDVYRLFDSDILKLSGPISSAHQDQMLNDISQTFRQKLYYNKYRYKVSCKMYRYEGNMDVFEDIVDFVTSSFEPENYFLNSILKQYPRLKALDAEFQSSRNGRRPFYRSRWGSMVPFVATGSVFLKEYNDVCAMHLMFKPYITDSSKVVLIEELE